MTRSQDWWRQAAVYQIYPRSFADANGDGIGDLEGIISRIPYLKALGVDAVWLCPFYPSPLNDGGYFRDVDPRIGSLAQFEDMTRLLDVEGIKVIIDIVPNHASSEHPWFQSAISSPSGSAERARFHFVRGQGEGGREPPNDWEGTFGGRAWTPSGADDGEWYLHLFDQTQPDLNWSNPEVVADFEKTIRFWADKGVAGFRVDVAAGCAKDLSPEMLALPWETIKQQRADMSRAGGKKHDCPIFDRDEVLEVYKGWRGIMNEYDPPLTAVAEAFVAPERKRLYADPSTLGQVFSFDLMFCNFDAADYRQVIERQMQLDKEHHTGSTWVLSTHDVVRHGDRYGLDPNPADTLQPFLRFYQKWTGSKGEAMQLDRERGERRARAASLMMMGLPGSCYLYQGEELCLPQVLDTPDDRIQDPRFFRSNGIDRGRDGCRIPLPWTHLPNDNFGFSKSSTADSHLPQPTWWGDHSVEKQEQEVDSTLNMYKSALALRREMQKEETLAWVSVGQMDTVLAFDRPGGWRVVLNTGDEGVELPEGADILVASARIDGRTLPGETAVWLQM